MTDQDEIDLNHAQKIGSLESEVHGLNKNVSKLFEKFDTWIEKSQPKPLTFGTIVGSAVAILSIFAILFGSVIYIANSSNAPILAQMQQLNVSIQTINKSTIQNTSFIQLTNQKLSGIDNKVLSNEDTLRWLIFTENIPKQLTQTQGRLNTLEMQMNRIVSQVHNKGN